MSKHTPGPFSAAEVRVMREALAQLLAGDSDLGERDLRAGASALEKLGKRRSVVDTLVSALRLSVDLLRKHVDPADLSGSRFDLADCKDMAPIFAAIAKATGDQA